MSTVMENLILCHPKDSVATARSPLNAGSLLRLTEQKTITVKEQIPFGHKIALQKIRRGGPVIKYGERIGKAIREIKPGEWVHVHNVTGERGRGKAKRIGHRA
jgi:altronate dehydratase